MNIKQIQFLKVLLGCAACAILAFFSKLYFDQLVDVDSGLIAFTVITTICTLKYERCGGLITLFFILLGLIAMHLSHHDSLFLMKIEPSLLTRFAITNLVIIFAIDRAQVAKQIAESSKETLHANNAKLKQIIHAATDMQTETDPARVAFRGFKELNEMVGADIFFNYQIESINESGRPTSMKLIASEGLDPVELVGFAHIENRDIPCTRCAIHNGPLILTHIQQSHDPLTANLRPLGVRSYVGFQLKARGKLHGTLCILSRLKDQFTPEEIDIMQTIALQVAGAQERIKREELIKEGDETIRLASMVARLAVSRVNYDKGTVDLDSLAASLYGMGSQPMTVSRNEWHATFHPEDRKLFDKHLSETIASGTDGWVALEHRIVLPDGTTRWLNIRKQIYFQADANGQRRPIHAIVAAHDVTEERLAAEELKATEARLRMMYETSMMGILHFDADGRITDTNDGFLKMIGWTRDQFNLNPVYGRDITQPRQVETSRKALEEFKRTGKIVPFEKEYIRRDGTVFPALVSATAVDEKWNEGVAFIVDLTYLKTVEQELRNLTENLERRVTERTEELNERSKQLRGMALDLADTEARERKRLAQILHDHFQQLISAAKLKVGIVRRKSADDSNIDAFRQIESLLDEAITESRSLATELSPPVLHDAGLQAGFEWLARKMLRDYGLHINVLVESGSEPDNERIRLVLFDCVREMLFNVVKHAGVKNAEIIMRIRVEGLLSIMVRDSGRGFSPNRDLTQHSPAGSFGLFSIRERLSMLGGLLDIRSAPGQGTELEISIPVTTRSENSDTVLDTRFDQVDPTAESIRTVRVLVADDHKMFREGLISLIQQESYVNVVGEAGDGAEALELARQFNPDILICDVTMPKYNGIEVTSILHRENPNIRVIGLSMHERDDMAKAMKDAGAVAYCTKGGPTEILLNVLKSVASETVQNV